MDIFRPAVFRALAAALALPLSAAFLAGCNVDSVDSTSAVLSDNTGTIYNFSGLYIEPKNDGSTNGVLSVVYPTEAGRRPSGELVTFLRILQYGSVLEAYDSTGLTWGGSISAIQGGTASFSLSGRTTVGQPVEIAGTMVYAEQHSTMDATWIEPSYYGTLYAVATVSPSTTNTPVTGLSISPKSTARYSETFTARDGTGTYSWEVSNPNYGTVSPSSGASVSYTSKMISGSVNKITVRDSNGNYDSASATYSTSVASNNAGDTNIVFPPTPG